MDREFWNRINDLLLIFKIIYNTQKSSESTESTITHISPHQDKIENDLKALLPMIPELTNFLALNSSFRNQKKLQLKNVHKAAYQLDPINIKSKIQEPEKTDILKQILVHSDIVDKNAFLKSFQEFYNTHSDFNISNISQVSKDDPSTFWMTYTGDHQELASFAIRLFNLIYNSVLSERVWSVMNII